MTLDFHVVIPARMASTRLPNKPLLDIEGVPMVVRVARRAALSAARSVTVACDDLRILQACQDHGIHALRTRENHPSGSDRLAEACELLNFNDETAVVNVQGDEPLIDPRLINACAEMLESHPECAVSTVAHRLNSSAGWRDPNVVKVVVDARSRALYFSRAPIPAWRDAPPSPALSVCPATVLRHVGLYAYRAGFLKRFPALAVSPLEQAEMLEQLRVLWHGERIAVHVTEHVPAAGVDTPEDLARVRQAVLVSRQQGAA